MIKVRASRAEEKKYYKWHAHCYNAFKQNSTIHATFLNAEANCDQQRQADRAAMCYA
jgi:hypothetical protein